jgi:pSer/pThr/pTyr-binding forkhead associated (FHA) protein
MSVEVKNLQTGETFEVGADGVVFGRMGGGAAIQVDDRSVSKKHARIFSDGAQWFIEDMGSVNGTVVDGNKIGGAVPLSMGLVFSLSKHRFEVLRLPGRAGAPAAAPPELETRTSLRHGSNNAANLPSDLRKDPVPRRRQSPPRAIDDDIAPPEATRGELPLASDQDFPSQQSLGTAGGTLDGAHEGGRPHLGIDDYDEPTPAEALSMGLGYLMKTTPVLALNPPGTVRSHITHPPLPGLQKVALALLVLPAYVALITINGGAAAVAAAVAGQFSIVAFLTAPIAGVIGGAIGALIVGFLAHPILSWLVDKLGGNSDAPARTAHVAMGVAAMFILVVPHALATVLTAVIARLASVSSVFALLQIVPALVSIVAMPLPMFVQWSWWKSYGVAKWFQMLLLVLMGLSALGGLVAAVGSIADAVSVMRSGGSAVVAPDVPTSDTPTPDAPVTTTATSIPTPDTPIGAGTTPPPAVPSTALPTTTPKPPDAALPATTKVRVDEGYAQFAQRRAEIEALLERDPTIIDRSERVRGLYQSLLQRTGDAEDQVNRDFRKSPSALNPLQEKARKSRVYDLTRETVKDLHRELFGS